MAIQEISNQNQEVNKEIKKQSKVCSRCKQEKNINDFYTQRKATGLEKKVGVCKACYKKQRDGSKPINNNTLLGEIREKIRYSPETGRFLRVFKSGRVSHVGIKPGVNGYVQICIGGGVMLAHRVAWFLTYGYLPVLEIDHINRIKSDNRISNLREVTPSQNSANTGIFRNNTSGHKGVSWSKVNKKWAAQSNARGKNKKIGYFTDIKDASKAYVKYSKEMYGDFFTEK